MREIVIRIRLPQRLRKRWLIAAALIGFGAIAYLFLRREFGSIRVAEAG